MFITPQTFLAHTTVLDFLQRPTEPAINKAMSSLARSVTGVDTITLERLIASHPKRHDPAFEAGFDAFIEQMLGAVASPRSVTVEKATSREPMSESFGLRTDSGLTFSVP